MPLSRSSRCRCGGPGPGATWTENGGVSPGSESQVSVVGVRNLSGRERKRGWGYEDLNCHREAADANVDGEWRREPCERIPGECGGGELEPK